MYQSKHKRQLKRKVVMIGLPESISFQAAFFVFAERGGERCSRMPSI